MLMISENDPRFTHLEKKIGIFAAVALVSLITVIIFIGADSDLFTPKYLLKFTVERGTGYARGMPVKLSGFRIGRIKAISLNEVAKVDIEIQIGREYQKWIKKDSVARLVKEGLVGDSIIEVSVGSPHADVLKDGDFIVFEKTRGLEEVANDLADQIKPVLLDVRDIISYVNDPNGDIKRSMKNIRELTAELHGTRQKVDLLLVDSSQKVGQLTTDMGILMKSTDVRMKSITPVLEKVDRSLAVVEEKLPPLLDRAAAAMEHLDAASRNTEKMTKTVLPMIPNLLGSMENTLLKTDTVLDAVLDVWPLKNHVPAQAEFKIVPGGSYE